MELSGVPTPADPEPILFFFLPFWTFPGGILGAGAFLGWGGALGFGHSRSRPSTSLDPVTHSSRRLLKCSQWTKYSHLSSGLRFSGGSAPPGRRRAA